MRHQRHAAQEAKCCLFQEQPPSPSCECCWCISYHGQMDLKHVQRAKSGTLWHTARPSITAEKLLLVKQDLNQFHQSRAPCVVHRIKGPAVPDMVSLDALLLSESGFFSIIEHECSQCAWLPPCTGDRSTSTPPSLPGWAVNDTMDDRDIQAVTAGTH